MRTLLVLAGLSMAGSGLQAAEAPVIADQPGASSGLLDRLFPTSHPVATHRRPHLSHLRPHDTARPVVRVAHADAHEGASAGVGRAGPRSDRGAGSLERLAVLDRASVCDSILCPGYTMLGVGF